MRSLAANNLFARVRRREGQQEVEPQVARLVKERTLLPVMMPLAPAATLPMRFPTHLATVLRELGISAQFVADQIEAMAAGAAIAKTAKRRVLGT